MQQLKQVELVRYKKALNCLFVKSVADSALRKKIATGYWIKQITLSSSNKTFSFESANLVSALQDPTSYPIKIVFLNPFYVASSVCSSIFSLDCHLLAMSRGTNALFRTLIIDYDNGWKYITKLKLR